MIGRNGGTTSAVGTSRLAGYHLENPSGLIFENPITPPKLNRYGSDEEVTAVTLDAGSTPRQLI